uniref:NADH dehydrogenase subunit 5 n=1 Tax=Halicryptus spinulosus TaxID=160677 RepID=UPI0002ADBE76|nr:NADH dehydrogenase subunit 5 [Halicryptus spinulosus]
MNFKFNYFLGSGSILFYFSSLMMLLVAVVCFLGQSVYYEWELVSLNSVMSSFVLVFDWISLLFLSLVLLISSMVIMFSNSYMSDEKFKARFVLLVLLFVASMGLVIVSPNLISILIGWYGLGLVSFLLVVYFQNFKSMGAGMITALSNRIGDVGILLSIGLFFSMGSWNFSFYMDKTSNMILTFAVCCVFLAGLTKSAQMPFSAWLPAAMAAPTPVSALVHSSTLVAAGVYLLIRFSYLIKEIWWLGSVLLFLSSMTMFMAGICANYEMDLKKIIALSTLSQLGLMMSSIALGLEVFAYFHLLTHAMFSALLFLCAGAIIHNGGGSQDIRFMGSIVTFMPIVSVCLNCANLALCGIPFLAGFYSKDFILEGGCFYFSNYFGLMLLYLATGMTAMYSLRLSFYSLWGWNQHLTFSLVGVEDKEMVYSMLVLATGAVVSGAILSNIIFSDMDFLYVDFFLKILVLLVTGLGAWLGVLLSLERSEVKNSKSLWAYGSSYMFSTMWLMSFLSSKIIVCPLWMGQILYKVLDMGWLEYLGAQGAYSGLVKMSNFLQLGFLGSIKTYFLLVIFSFIFLILITF